MVIEAIGEKMSDEVAKVLGPLELNKKGLVQVDRETWMTSEKGIFAAGGLG